MSQIEDLQAKLRAFADERDWNQFHSPKNLILALAGELGELAELFQWLTESQAARIMDDPDKASQVRDEVADVFVYLLRLADVLGIDLSHALLDKVAANAHRYPIDLARGNAKKYTDLAGPR